MRGSFGDRHAYFRVLRLYRRCPEVRGLSGHPQNACRIVQADSRVTAHGEASRW
jgi:hypothetical protein